MDPDANLNEQLNLANAIVDKADENENFYTDETVRLAELVVSLDEWLKKGGMPPQSWKDGLIQLFYGNKKRGG